MRFETPAQAKGGKTPTRPSPRHGTIIRDVYDMFKANTGIPVKFWQRDGKHNNTRVIYDLRDYYGLDIRCIRSGTWVLAGEWFGSKYVDYIAERIHAPTPTDHPSPVGTEAA